MFHHHHHHKHGEQAEQTAAAGATTATTGATPVQRDVKNAALVEEKIHHKEDIHKQDVVTQDIEKTEVKQVIQPVHETQMNAPLVHEQTLPAQRLEVNKDRGVAPISVPGAKRIEAEKTVQNIQHAPIIQERVHHKVIEEVQPVVQRDVIQPHQVLVKQPVHEHIVEAPKVTTVTAPVIETSSGLPPTVLNTANYKTEPVQPLLQQQQQQPLQQQGGGMIHQTLHGDTLQNTRLVEQKGLGGKSGLGGKEYDGAVPPPTSALGQAK